MQDHQSTQGLITLISLSAVCVIILITTYILTFIKKTDTSDKAH
ncbi:MAG: hypothetical protein V4541_07100 [Bacteroidota bacterium]